MLDQLFCHAKQENELLISLHLTYLSLFLVPKADILESEQVAASLFFTAIFGERAAKGLNILVVLSAFGNLVSVLIGQSRVIREIGRQGVLPWPRFWATTRPFGTPVGPYLLKWGMTILMILAPPAGDAFNFGKLPCPPNNIFLPGPPPANILSSSSRRPPNLPRLGVPLPHGRRYLPDPPAAQAHRRGP